MSIGSPINNLIISTHGRSFIYCLLYSDHLEASITLHFIAKCPWMYFYKTRNIAFHNKITVQFSHKIL